MGNLSKNEQYNFVGVTDLGEMNYNSCQNCNRAIRYVAELETSEGKSVYVGTECAKTLSSYNISNEWSMIEQLNEMKKLATAINLVANGRSLKFWGGKDQDYLIIIGRNSRGTAKKIKVEKLFDVFLQKEYEFINTFLKDIYQNQTVITEGWCIWDYEQYLKSLKLCKQTF